MRRAGRGGGSALLLSGFPGGTIAVFKKLAAELPLPLFLYNAPLNTHLSLEIATVIEAAGEPNIVGLKDSGLNMGYFHAVERGSGRCRISACW